MPDKGEGKRGVPAPAHAKPPSILIVDDDTEIRYSLTRVFSSRGYKVTEAPSGEAGLALVKKGQRPTWCSSTCAWAAWAASRRSG